MRFLALALTFFLLSSSGCAAFRLAGYAIAPDYPEADDIDTLQLPDLRAPVKVHVREDGIYRIEAQSEHDLFLAQGYLQARDRMFQLDFLRHMAKGQLTELLGMQSMGDKSTLDLDVLNRFLGFRTQAEAIYASFDARERENADAFTKGINHWLATGPKALEHRLLDAEVAPWKPTDSLAIFRILMFGLTHNYTRELRRLVIACAAGLDALEKVWPSTIEFPVYYLPEENLRGETYPVAPAIVPEMRAELASLCPAGAQSVQTAQATNHEVFNPLSLLSTGIQASNNWTISGSRTRSGKPIYANDPHLPQLNPPIVIGVEQHLPENRVAGFTIVGIHRVFVGHNYHVAWGSTINNVDMQDLYVEKPAQLADGTDGYLYEGESVAYEVRKESFRIKGGETVERSVRFTKHGPVLNDLDPWLQDRIPVTTLRTIDLKDVGDSMAVRDGSYARNATEYVEGMRPFDSACINWSYADLDGNIGLTLPCRAPKRPAFLGSFPVPGWLAAYEWAGYYEKDELPSSMNPRQRWIATANNRAVPSTRFPSTYNNDPSPPNRYVQIANGLQEKTDWTVDDVAALQLDTGISYWPKVQADLQAAVCAAKHGSELQQQAANALCSWDGHVAANAAGATLFTYFTHAMLDRAMADELPGGVQGELWKWVQSIPHFETNVDWTWTRPATDAVWDITGTETVETRDDIYRLAFADAVEALDQRFGDDVEDWAWGAVRPFELRHFFGGKGGVLGAMFNGPTLTGTGAPETVFKNQYLRSDREAMHVMAGPSLRFIADLNDLSNSRFTLAGGASGWPSSPHYADLTEEWMNGKTRLLSPKEEDLKVKAVWQFVP
jgi:penicillin amidase